jgi:hypothetical protein
MKSKDMNQMRNIGDFSTEGLDPVWKLLSRDGAAHPCQPTPWFAARTTALVLGTRERRSLFSLLRDIPRWLIPVPLAGLAALLLPLLHHAIPTPPALSALSSDEEFEQHMALLASVDQGEGSLNF